MYVPRKSVKDAATAAKGGLPTPSAPVPPALGGTISPIVEVAPSTDVVSVPPVPTSLVVLEALAAPTHDAPFRGRFQRPERLAPLGGASSVEEAALIPARCHRRQPQAPQGAGVESEVVPSSYLSRHRSSLGANAENWRQVELASSWGHLSLSTIEETLGSFGDAISIVRPSMMRDIIPCGQVRECPFLVVLSLVFLPSLKLIVEFSVFLRG